MSPPPATPAVIFGGAGFIGRHLAHALVERGHRDVWLCDIAEPRWAATPEMRFHRCDVREPIELDGFDVPPLVFNLAAVHRTPGHEDREYHETNERGAEHVAGFCERRRVTDVWFTSSIAVYAPSEAPIDENGPLRPESAYGRSKVAAERRHREWAHGRPGRHLVIVRPGTVFGPGEGGNFTRLAEALTRRRFVYPGRRDTVKACGYVGDLVESLFFMREYASPVVTYNFSYDPPPTIEEVCSAFATAGRLPRPVGRVPLPLVMGVSRLLFGVGVESFRPERVAKLSRSTNIHPRALVELGFPYSTDIRSGLAAWRDASPRGRFV